MTNICSEITLFTDEEHSFICCLSSVNLTKWHEWKNTDLIETAIYFLDGVLEEFLAKTSGRESLVRAHRSAKKGRAARRRTRADCGQDPLPALMLTPRTAFLQATMLLLFSELPELFPQPRRVIFLPVFCPPFHEVASILRTGWGCPARWVCRRM